MRCARISRASWVAIRRARSSSPTRRRRGRHFQIRADGKRWLVRDLGSKNSTYLNEEDLKDEREIAAGDQLQVGETIFSFLDESSGATGRGAGLSGKEIGGYKILDRLGRGGMGTVYKARQISLNRVVALKILSAKYSRDPEFVRQFVSEARAAGQLNHPNVVQVFDVTEVGGLHMFSMELMEGGSVQDMLAAVPDSRLPWTEALPLVMDAARGLVFAEKRGIVHRDIKPDNMMLTSEQKVKIADLGLAMNVDEGASGKIFGTPHFISPEQALGKEVSHAADIYSLGASFYRMVAGKTPFSGNTVKEILRCNINEKPEPIRNIAPEFPPDLVSILDKMMEKQVEDRYRSAADLLADFEAFELAHQIELAGGVRKSNKPLLIGIAVVALTAVGLAIHFAMKPAETNTVIIDNTDNSNDPPPVVPKVKTPEELKEEQEGDARTRYFELRDKDRGEISLESKADWLALATEYRGVKDEFPRAEREVEPALKRAQEIEDQIAALEKNVTQKLEAAQTWWKSEKATIEGRMSEGAWGPAIQAAQTALADAKAVEHMASVPEAKPWLEKVENECLRQAEESLTQTLKAAKANKDGGKADEAVSAVAKWARNMRKHAAGYAELQALATSADDWVEETSAIVLESLKESLRSDSIVFIDAYRAVRNPSAQSKVFDYDFAGAADDLEKDRPRLRSYLYQHRLDAVAQRLRAIQTSWDSWVDLVASGQLFSEKDQIKDVPGAVGTTRATLDADKPADRDGFNLKLKYAAGFGKKHVSWSELTPSQLSESLVTRKLDEIDGEMALGLSWMFTELADAPGARACYERAKAAGAQLTPATEASLLTEIRAIEEYSAIVEDADSDPSATLAAIDDWRKRRGTTDTTVLLDGRAPEKMPHIFTQAEVDEFLKNWGREDSATNGGTDHDDDKKDDTGEEKPK